ncbi:MAG: hypothetical protein O7D97_06910 [Planctomycetota bacterium]|nr:hypothetical protein [Planctomycetota bacterium]MCZ6811721.1 hypothetical protein [Planctomycetota bacterium]
MIRLQGGLKLDAYWREVRQTGDERLQEAGFEDWVVTMRPLTLPETGRAEAHEEEPAVTVSVTAKTLGIAVGKQPDLPPESYVQTSIIDVIDQAIDARGDGDSEDWLRDEGGEA